LTTALCKQETSRLHRLTWRSYSKNGRNKELRNSRRPLDNAYILEAWLKEPRALIVLCKTFERSLVASPHLLFPRKQAC
jgi:hypothetical protein